MAPQWREANVSRLRTTGLGKATFVSTPLVSLVRQTHQQWAHRSGVDIKTGVWHQVHYKSVLNSCYWKLPPSFQSTHSDILNFDFPSLMFMFNKHSYNDGYLYWVCIQWPGSKNKKNKASPTAVSLVSSCISPIDLTHSLNSKFSLDQHLFRKLSSNQYNTNWSLIASNVWRRNSSYLCKTSDASRTNDIFRIQQFSHYPYISF